MRTENRNFDELRKIEIIPDFNPYAEGSCLIKCGQTHVICTATVEEKVPAWLKAEEKGWITAEYSLLPRATKTRVNRETHGVGGRTHEIQRLIGRSLRAVVDLSVLKGFTILIDCDVIQADGGTRTASITGGFVALAMACQRLVEEGVLEKTPLRHYISAISVGIVDGEPMLDLCYVEDSAAEVDMNIVVNDAGGFVELQGTGEHGTFSQEQLHQLLALGEKGNRELQALQKKALDGLEL